MNGISIMSLHCSQSTVKELIQKTNQRFVETWRGNLDIGTMMQFVKTAILMIGFVFNLSSPRPCSCAENAWRSTSVTRRMFRRMRRTEAFRLLSIAGWNSWMQTRWLSSLSWSWAMAKHSFVKNDQIKSIKSPKNLKAYCIRRQFQVDLSLMHFNKD